MPFFSDNGFGLGHPWFQAVMELREGLPPSKQALEFGFQSKKPVPEEVQRWLADFLAGKVKRRVGGQDVVKYKREIDAQLIILTKKHLVEDVADSPRSMLKRVKEMLEKDGVHFSYEKIRDVIYGQNGWDEDV